MNSLQGAETKRTPPRNRTCRLPRVGALRSLVARIRANPWLAVGIAAAALLVAAWLGWAIYVASDRGTNEGLGVLITWPAIALAVALVSLPFIGGYLLVKRLSSGDEGTAETTAEATKDEGDQDEADHDEDDQEEEPEETAEQESDDSEEEEPEGGTDEESEDEDDSESEAKAAKS